MNYQIIKWAGGINLDKDNCTIYKKFKCQCESEF